MYLDKYREVIKTSTHNIPERLRAIDKDYFVVRNHKTGQFEVHNSAQRDNTLALNIPYPELDERTVRLVKDTRIEHSKEIFKKMDEKNRKLELEAEEKRHIVTKDILTDMYKYCTSHESKETIDENSELVRKGVENV